MTAKPTKWNEITLDETAANGTNSFVDGPFGSNLVASEYSTEGIRLIQLQNIGDGFWVDENQKYIPPSKFETLRRHAAFPGDIAIAKMAAPIARACILPPLEEKYLVVADCIKLSPNLKEFDPEFLVYAINNYYFRHQAEIKSNGTTRARINLSILKKIKLKVPLLYEQQKISCVLKNIDTLINQSEGIIRKLKGIKAGTIQRLLFYGIDDKGNIRDPKSTPENFKNTNAGFIPKSWDAISLGDLATHIGSGATPTGGSKVYKSEGILFIRSQNVTFEGLLLDDVAYIEEKTHLAMSRSEIFPHDVLLNITGASIGRCCVFPEGLGLANVNQHVCALRVPDPSREKALFLSTILASNIGQSQIDKLNAGGNRQGLNYEQIRKFVIPWIWDDDEIARIVAVIDGQNDKIKTEELILAKYQNLKQGLMQDLLSESASGHLIFED